jgi:hypothetical protein
MMTDDEKCRWHDERLSLIEGGLWGSPPERAGGLFKQMKMIESTLTELKIWIRALALFLGFLVLLFGPQRMKEIVGLLK